jgi:hypothetical protein
MGSVGLVINWSVLLSLWLFRGLILKLRNFVLQHLKPAINTNGLVSTGNHKRMLDEFDVSDEVRFNDQNHGRSQTDSICSRVRRLFFGNFLNSMP